MPERSSSCTSQRARPVRVLKFGGTSVGAADGLRNVCRIIRDAVGTCHPVVVVSAASGVTDDLVRAADETRGDRATAEAWVRHVGRRYRTLAKEVVGDGPACSQYEPVLQAELSELRRALQGGAGTDASAARDAVMATGERLMAPLLAALLAADGCPARPVDATALIRTDDAHGDATVQWEPTRQQTRAWFREWTEATEIVVPVVTGFIGATAEGTTTTIGRGGSDLSAATLARALEAERLERWTNVDGLYTRDPATHDDARRLHQLDFEQARTWTKAGRLGMHPCTLDPLAAADIPVHVRCTHRPDAEGTRIVPAASTVHS
ncbi:aspartate kinase [Salinibacter sp. 10B]|uniref:aspartate kinase n=1 Tax=Salinibacter sp. 10B TaxID=1923971 RepID=UPI000CF547B1|nr:aspartate kinase [Salinibacter sp. 10B]PQJ35279.1 aspartate kinase [Salinibacter sp. 10B]